ILSDGIAARIYPFIWGPQGAFDTAHFSLLLVISTGLGIVAGEYLFAWLSDRFGRRRILLLAGATCGLGTLPAAFTSNFYLLAISLGLGAMGIGGVLATNIVYMAEIAPNKTRGRMTQTSQAIAPFLLNVLGNLSGLVLMPAHYQLLVLLIAAAPLLVFIPLVAFLLPESPRWLESQGRHDEADRVVATLEKESEARAGPLPAPETGVAPSQPTATWWDLVGTSYRGRTALLLICWVLGYSGLVYGPLGFLNLYLVKVGFNAQAIFTAGLVAGLIGSPGGLLIAGRLNERFERRDVILGGAVIASAGLLLTFLTGSLWHNVVALAISSSVVTAGLYVWLFNMYTYTTVAYPTRIRGVATGWTDGFGHVGAMISPLVIGPLFVATASAGYIGFFGWVIIPGALLPAALLARFGIQQRAVSLEAVTGG
ncbi:MAG TPA: MFS transporter, partial [Candidatus Dormibacteraeota bacterium]|nr:MFS transporter [Candidatus Dormibacteraeota bacterium]